MIITINKINEFVLMNYFPSIPQEKIRF